MDPNITDLQTQLSNTQGTNQFTLFAELICTAVAFVLLSIASNSFTLIVLRTSEIFHEIDLILFRLLAVEDMISSVIYLTSVILFDKADYRRLAVPFFRYCATPLLYQIIGVILTISICRYLMIVRPLHYPMWVTRKRIIVSQAVLFVMSFVLSFLMTLLAKWISNNFEEEHYTYGSNGTSLIPMAIGFLVQVFTGSHILYISVRQSRRLRRVERIVFHQEHRQNGHRDPGDPDNPEILREPKRKFPGSFKGLKTVLVIVGSYWIAWFPLFMFTFRRSGLLELPVWFLILAYATSLVNNCWNPLIYYFTNRAFRDAAKRMIRRMKLFQVCRPQSVSVVE